MYNENRIINTKCCGNMAGNGNMAGFRSNEVLKSQSRFGMNSGILSDTNKGRESGTGYKSRAGTSTEEQDTNKKCRKHSGYLYTIEVMIVVAIIVISVAYLFRYPISVATNDEAVIRQYGINVLNYLAMDNLRYLAYNDISGLNNRIDSILPGVIESVACVDCSGVDVPKEKSVIILSYYLAGYDSYEPETLKLYLWRKTL